MNESVSVRELAQKARVASAPLSASSLSARNQTLLAIAEEISSHVPQLLQVNQEDVEQAREEKLAAPLLSRLQLTKGKCQRMIEELQALAALPDPLGTVSSALELSEGLELYRVSCPIGVIGVIFESRPDALIQISALCLKSGNAVLLKGGREALRTNEMLTSMILRASRKCGLPEGWCSLLHTREDVQEMLKLHELIDLIIPRGSNAFVRYIMQNSQIPVLGLADGLCHVYVDDEADLDKALNIIVNAKTSRPSVCNAEEVCLVHKDIAAEFLPRLKKALVDDRQAAGLIPVELRLDEKAAAIIPGTSAGEKDFDTEFLDYILAVGVVEDVKAAVSHILEHSTGHSEAIITENPEHAELFTMQTDSAAVYVNVSTRFTDGGEFGLGCEMGISTQKLHARGPMGLDALSTYKYIITGNGQIR